MSEHKITDGDKDCQFLLQTLDCIIGGSWKIHWDNVARQTGLLNENEALEEYQRIRKGFGFSLKGNRGLGRADSPVKEPAYKKPKVPSRAKATPAKVTKKPRKAKNLRKGGIGEGTSDSPIELD